MRHCEACGREFGPGGRSQTCTHCGFNASKGPMPRTKASLDRLERQRRAKEEMENELRDYLDIDTD